ncbi:hypothetical protein [Streptomyces sp. NPDC048611]|uniref:hypothetical protein n=1 Tax=Streptomyces sp. NPDC048611 TaxID=3155635 RepID=UPI00341B0233
MIFVHPFRKAVEAGDVDAVAGPPTENAAFTSPADLSPSSRTRARRSPPRPWTASSSRAATCPHFDENGESSENSEIDDFMEMLRPFSAAKARAGARGATSGSIAREEAGHE